MISLLKKLILKPPLRYKLIFPGIFKAHPDEEMLRRAMEFVAHNNISGDYLEFGVWKGRSLIRAFNIWKRLFNKNGQLKDTRFYVFDSFEGLPEIKTTEDLSTGEFARGQYLCTEENFKANIKAGGVDLERVGIVKGWYDQVLNNETKNKLPIKSAAVVFIDCDLYESTVPVLNFITDYIVDGTILIFDDWFCFKGSAGKGEQKAFYEWLAKNPNIKAVEYHKFNWRGNSFIINRK